MNVWGRIHTNGSIWFAPEPTGGVYLKNLTERQRDGRAFRHRLRYDLPGLGAGRWSRRRPAAGHVYVRVYHLTSTTDNKTVYNAGTNPAGDYVEINNDITSANADAQKTRFTDPNGCSYVMTGVPKSPSISFNATFREGFYESRARAPERSEYFGLTIVIEGNGGGSWPPRNATTDVTGTLHIYAATKDFAYDYKTFPDGVKIEDVTAEVFNAGNNSDIGGGTQGDIVFSPETIRNNWGTMGKFPAH